MPDGKQNHKSSEEVGVREDANHAVADHNWQPLDLVSIHEINSFAKTGGLGDGYGALRHDLIDPAVSMDMGLRPYAVAKQERKPSRSPLSRAWLAVLHQIALAQDAHE
jgi:hypothetical protein